MAARLERPKYDLPGWHKGAAPRNILDFLVRRRILSICKVAELVSGPGRRRNLLFGFAHVQETHAKRAECAASQLGTSGPS